MNKSVKTTLMQLQVSLSKRIFMTLVIMLALIFFVYYFKIPNPNMILISGLILASALFGFGGGVVASIIMFGYTLFFFSTNHNFTQFTIENLQKVGVSLVGIVTDMLLVCFLKQTEVRAFQKIEALRKKLDEENRMLQEISFTDALTGIRNRMALHNDLDLYFGHEAAVVMLDLNDFKTINDTCGHEEGDRILSETGKLLAETFGENHCYRYGGDEFLIILPDISEEDFNEKLNFIKECQLVIGEHPNLCFSGFSIGYIHAALNDINVLKNFIAQADTKMYEAKRAYKSAKKKLMATSGRLERPAYCLGGSRSIH